MTLTQRNEQIERMVRQMEQIHFNARQETIIELACDQLSRTEGLVVTPDEVTRTLSRAAGFPLEGGA